ncbi:hypothetical protein O3M35_001796 [Rhynocoris fuscipes]|uniref:Phosphatidylserine decarboxylase proenzyme, mitochondrial n=1 Tax=Rhynocoris fuscipes TaxID=488301 RepID=A0AAW1CQ70_9HEMI
MLFKFSNFYLKLKLCVTNKFLLGFISLEVIIICYLGHSSILKRVWNSWVPIPTGVGLTLLAILQWRRLEKERRKKLGTSDVAGDWEVTCYKSLPLRAMSRMCGHLSRVSVPTLLRNPIYGSYARFFSVDTSEMSQPIIDYGCFGDFFARDLKEGVRPLDEDCLVSPADGRVLNFGLVESVQIEQVKGITYSIKTFLGDLNWKIYNENTDINFNELSRPHWNEYKKKLLHNPDNELYQCVIYLAPGDYHRFHSPVDWKVNFRRHFNGELLSVNPAIAKWIPGLFALNERVVYFGTWKHGFFSFTAVGATNVGSIIVYDDKNLKTNTKIKWRERYKHDKPDEENLNFCWRKGEQIGEFRLGSTIVLLLEAPKDFQFNLKIKEHLKVGKSMINNFIEQDNR